MESLDGSLNLTQQVTHELGRAIVQGEYLVDAPFPTEADLSARYSISRSVTREAVKMLTAKGLVSSRPRKGIRVLPAAYWNMFDTDVLTWTLNARPTLALLKEFTQFRMAIEPEAAALASTSATPEQLGALQSALERMGFAEQGKGDALDADIDFHSAVLRASNNRFYIQLCGFIRAALRISSACANQYRRGAAVPVDEYWRMFDFIRKGQPLKAKQTMRALLEEEMELIVKSIGQAESAEPRRHAEV